MSRLDDELRRVFGDPPVAPRAVVRVQVGGGQGYAAAGEEADRLVDAGADLVVLDAPGARPVVLGALAALIALDPVAVVGTESPEGWRERVLTVRSALRALRPLATDPTALLAQVDDPALVRTCGLLVQLGARHTPVLCGGGVTTAVAALLGARLAPDAAGWWLAGSSPVLPAARQAWQAIGRQPLLDLGLGDTSADVAVAVVRAGLELLGA